MLRPRNPALGVFLGVSAGFVIGRDTTFMSPWLFGAYMDELNLPATKAGTLISSEFIGIALAAIFIAPVIASVSKQKVALLGACAAMIFHFLSIFLFDYLWLSFFRFGAGLGEGMTLAAATATVALQSNPEKLYAHVHIVMAVSAAITQYVVGFLVVSLGYQGIFSLLGALCLLCMPFLFNLPETRKRTDTQKPVGRFDKLSLGIVTSLAVFLFSVAESATWTFLERAGQYLHLTSESIGLILGSGVLIGFSGAVLAGWMNVRFGRSLPLSLGLLITAITMVAMYNLSTAIIFGAAFLLFEIAWYFSIPFILGVAAALDKEGRWAAVASSALLLGFAVAPTLFGGIVEAFGLQIVGMLGGGLVLASLLILLLVVKQLTIQGSPLKSELETG